MRTASPPSPRLGTTQEADLGRRASTPCRADAERDFNGKQMTEFELEVIEARLPKGVERVGAQLDASQLAAAVRCAWSEGVELRQGLTDVRNSSARAAQEREAAGATAERYKVERDALVERCARLRKALAELLYGFQIAPQTDVALSETLASARKVLDEAN